MQTSRPGVAAVPIASKKKRGGVEEEAAATAGQRLWTILRVPNNFILIFLKPHILVVTATPTITLPTL
jgi:hypothetical protein